MHHVGKRRLGRFWKGPPAGTTNSYYVELLRSIEVNIKYCKEFIPKHQAMRKPNQWQINTGFPGHRKY